MIVGADVVGDSEVGAQEEGVCEGANVVGDMDGLHVEGDKEVGAVVGFVVVGVVDGHEVGVDEGVPVVGDLLGLALGVVVGLEVGEVDVGEDDGVLLALNANKSGNIKVFRTDHFEFWSISLCYSLKMKEWYTGISVTLM
eukprot:jgi/Bigna1/67023/fgenesh1_pg.2_\